MVTLKQNTMKEKLIRAIIVIAFFAAIYLITILNQ